ncbi:AraC family ligand binding domain-containing protein [Lactonifactor longoviformis]|uniref:AraC family ligand binding domain-containing protein n=1 Tax=Lactonifactor longoviformis TaxID=341220 RepID=UPI0036F1F96E
MKKETRTVVYDDELRIEAYNFEGIVQPFPNHTIAKGDIVLFNPGDNHACVQSDDGTLDYRGFNITKEVMLNLAEEVTGKRKLPGFSKTVIFDEEVTCYLHPLHELVMKGSCEFGKEENLLLLISLLIQR